MDVLRMGQARRLSYGRARPFGGDVSIAGTVRYSDGVVGRLVDKRSRLPGIVWTPELHWSLFMHGPFASLLRFQMRILANNRPACVVLACLAVASVLPMPQRKASSDTCYILFWQEDVWVQRLRTELETRTENEPPIEIVPAERFVGEDGLIQYPMGTHSIQIRPPERPGDHWTVWCWYSGTDPSVLDRPAAWFWKVTREHFGEALPLEVRYSALNVLFDWPGNVSSVWSDFSRRMGTWSFVLWMALVFCACYLPALSLAQQRESRSIVTLVTAPVGWSGAVLSIGVFYTGIAVVVGILLAQRVQGGLVLLPLVALATGAYLGVGLCIGCSARTVGSASGGVILYSLVSGATVVGCAFAPPAIEPVVRAFSVEANVFGALRDLHGERALASAGMLGLLVSAILWQILGYVSCWVRRRCGV